MNKTVVVTAAIITTALVAAAVIYTQSLRYVTVNAGDGVVYRVDRRTGDTVILKGNHEYPVTR